MSPWPGPHTTARNCRTCGATQLGSCTVFSAHPTVCRALFVPVAKLLYPPSVGSARLCPFCHTKPEQLCLDWVKKYPQLQISLSGLRSPVSAMPLIAPRSFSTGQRTALFVPGPPNVPRSVTEPNRHSVAWRSPVATVALPATQPVLFTLVPTL